MIVYTLAPLIGGVIAGLIHWKTVTINRKFKFGNSNMKMARSFSNMLKNTRVNSTQQK